MSDNFVTTGAMCMVFPNGRQIDMGNYYIDEKTGGRVLLTSRELAEKYGHLVDVPIYVRKPEGGVKCTKN